MIDWDFPYGEAFQRRLLASLVQDPKRVSEIIQPHFLTTPILVDIAKTVADYHKKSPDAIFSYDFLKDTVKNSLSRNALKNWSRYNKALKAAFIPSNLGDQLFLGRAKEFAKACIYREALILAEKSISAGKYEQVHELIQKAQASADFGNANTVHWRDLPHPSDYPYQEIEWIVDGLIPAGHVIAISGEEGVGKTLLLLAMARSISEGTDFLERGTTETRVLYLGLDVSKVTLQNYMKMMRWNPDDRFRILTMWTDPEAPMLDGERLNWLYKYVEKYRPVLIFDTLRDFFDGEENSSTETKPVLDALKRMRSMGATPILIAHPPKSGNAAIRGTGNISQKVDVSYFVEKVKQQGKEIIRLTCPTKNRAGSPNFTLTIQKQFIPTPAGVYFNVRKVKDSRSSHEPKQNPQYAQLLTCLREHPGTNQKELASKLGMSDRPLRKLLQDLQLGGRVDSVRGKRKTVLWSAIDTQDDDFEAKGIKNN
jgi:hypothetical protein